MSLLKTKLANNKFVVGTWCEIPSPELVNVLAKAGLDFVIIDMEHGAMDFATASKMVMAADADQCAPLIRVATNDESPILRALELRPQGIIVPHIQSASDRKKAVTYSMFPPLGQRSLNPFTRAGGYHPQAGYTKEQNTKLLLSLIVEGKEGIENLETIIDKSTDVIYIGTYDISQALGLPNDVTNKRVLSVLKKAVKIIRQKNKVAGCMFHNAEELALFKSLGIQFLCYKVDTGVIFDEFQAIKNLI